MLRPLSLCEHQTLEGWLARAFGLGGKKCRIDELNSRIANRKRQQLHQAAKRLKLPGFRIENWGSRDERRGLTRENRESRLEKETGKSWKIEYQEPRIEKRESRNQHQELRTENENQNAEKRKSRIESSEAKRREPESRNENRKPRSENRESRDENREVRQESRESRNRDIVLSRRVWNKHKEPAKKKQNIHSIQGNSLRFGVELEGQKEYVSTIWQMIYKTEEHHMRSWNQHQGYEPCRGSIPICNRHLDFA